MSNALSSRLANHRFMTNIDFHHKGMLTGHKAVTKTFVDGSTVDIYQTDYRFQGDGIVYSFSVRGRDPFFTSHINFQIDDITPDCIGISGLKDSGTTSISYTNLAANSPRQNGAESLFSDFLHKLRNVYTGADMLALIENTLTEANMTLPHLAPTASATGVPALVP